MTHVRTFDITAGHMLAGFSGRAGAGKDTCADVLQRHGFVRLAFADALRDEVMIAFGVDRRMLTDRVAKELARPALAIANSIDSGYIVRMQELGHDVHAPRSARWTLQRWGTEYRRDTDSGYWIERALEQIHRLRASGLHRICITDVRFFNEAAVLDALGGEVFQVVRPNVPDLAADAATHASEGPVPCTGGVVHNDGDIEHLHAELLRVLADAGWRPSARESHAAAQAAAAVASNGI